MPEHQHVMSSEEKELKHNDAQGWALTAHIDRYTKHMHLQFQTHTHTHISDFDRVTLVCCSRAQSFLGWWYGCILRTLTSCFRMNHLHTHTHIQAQSLSMEQCGQAVNPWIRPFYERWTAEWWSLSPLSACIPARLTAVCQNTREVSGKLCGSVTFSATKQETQSSVLLSTATDVNGKKKPIMQYKPHIPRVNEVIWSACMLVTNLGGANEAPCCYPNIKWFIFWWEWKQETQLFPTYRRC